jgi:uncharacterized membrane protein
VSTNTPHATRLEFVDAQRGLAVLLMLWMHTADGWLQPELKAGAAWNVIRALGGLAAPTFLLLAGLSLGLGWGASERPHSPARQRKEVARGLQILVLGYGLRLQMWMLDAGGVRHLNAWIGAIPLAWGLWAAYRGLAAWAAGDRDAARRLGPSALVGLAVGAVLVFAMIPGRLWHLTRVDVLQAIGASLACLALTGAALRRSPLVGLAAAVVVGALTPWARLLVPGPLPHAIAGYIAAWDVAPGLPLPTLFPLFPWLAYPFVGAGVGLHLGREHRAGHSALRASLVLAAVGLVVALLTCEPLRPAHILLARWPFLTQAVRIAYRVGAALVLGGLAIGLSRPRVPLRNGLLTLGRASLFVYWVHLEFAFGILAKPIAHSLALRAWPLALALLIVVMTALASFWSRVRNRLFQAATRIGGADTAVTDPATLTHASVHFNRVGQTPD